MVKHGVCALVMVCFVLAGCSAPQPTSGDGGPVPDTTRLLDDGPPRYTRAFNTGNQEWGIESEMVHLQQDPFMVIWEVTEFKPGSEPTPEQRQAADELVERCLEAAERHGWFEYGKGVADGYAAMHGDLNHYRKNELLFDDAILDPDRPEVLMYYRTPEGQQLVGFMFQTSSRFERGPQIGGPLTVWHYHVWAHPRCVDDAGYYSGFVPPGESCEPGFTPYHRSYEMVHVWFIERPDGPFSSAMTVPQQELAVAIEKLSERRGL